MSIFNFGSNEDKFTEEEIQKARDAIAKRDKEYSSRKIRNQNKKSQNPSYDDLDALEKLQRLKDKGTISEQDFINFRDKIVSKWD